MRREWLNFHALWVLIPSLGLLPTAASAGSSENDRCAAPNAPLVQGPRLIRDQGFLRHLPSAPMVQGARPAPDGTAGTLAEPGPASATPVSSPTAAQDTLAADGVAASPVRAAHAGGSGAPLGGAGAPSGGTDASPPLRVDFGRPTPSLADRRAEAAEVEEERPVFQIRARVLARGTADARRDFDRKLSLATGELGATASLSLLEAELTADFADKAILKDAYVRLSTPSRELRLYGGQFKSPFLARRLLSRWDLPTVQRGLVADFLIDDHGLGGRRLGLMGEWRAKSLWNLRASVGVFEGGEDALGIRTGREDASGRVAIRPIKPLTLGASGYLVSAFDAAHRAGAGAVDATLKLEGLRLSGEFTAGRILPGDFTAQTALAAWALPLDAAERWALEPVLGAEALQLHGPDGGNGWVYTAGVNLLFLDAFKAMLQGEHALRPGDTRPALALFFQLASQLSLE